jgi:hypothetical protein
MKRFTAVLCIVVWPAEGFGMKAETFGYLL